MSSMLKVFRQKSVIFVAALSLILTGLAVTPAFAQSDIQNSLCAGANLDVNTDCSTGTITDEEASERINEIIRNIINLFSLVVGVVSVIMIIIGGLKYITSGGDPSNVSGAKNTILYAIIGIIIVALSQFIVRFVLSRFNQQ